jgi:hypothetical protein
MKSKLCTVGKKESDHTEEFKLKTVKKMSGKVS